MILIIMSHAFPKNTCSRLLLIQLQGPSLTSTRPLADIESVQERKLKEASLREAAECCKRMGPSNVDLTSHNRPEGLEQVSQPV